MAVEVNRISHVLTYHLRMHIAPIVEVHIEYDEHLDDDMVALDTGVRLRINTHSITIFCKDVPSAHARRFVSTAARRTFEAPLEIIEGSDGEVNEHDVEIRFHVSRVFVAQRDPEFRDTMNRFARELGEQITTRRER